jgi:RimJ/RimL family protein N-acetyltransferase
MRQSIEGSTIRLRALELADVYWYDHLPITSEYDDFGQQPPFNSADRWRADRLLTTDNGLLLVESTENKDRLGSVGWRTVSWGPSWLSRCLEIGISLIPEARGYGIGTEAQQLLMRYLFAETHVERIQAVTDVTNKREQRALEKAGFVAEGILRRAQHRRGEFHDLVIYSVVRADLR